MGGTDPSALRSRARLVLGDKPVYRLAVFIPIAIALELADVSPSLVFASSALGIVPAATSCSNGAIPDSFSALV